MEQEDPIAVVDSITKGLFSLAANMQSRADDGEEFPEAEIKAIAKRLQDYAGDLQLAHSRLA